MSARCCHVDNNDDYTHVNDEDNNDDWNHADDDGNKMTIPMLMKMITTWLCHADDVDDEDFI